MTSTIEGALIAGLFAIMAALIAKAKPNATVWGNLILAIAMVIAAIVLGACIQHAK